MQLKQKSSQDKKKPRIIEKKKSLGSQSLKNSLRKKNEMKNQSKNKKKKVSQKLYNKTKWFTNFIEK
jgi:hypothetical protein